MGSIGIGELIVLFLILLLFFGASRLPELGKSLGAGIKNFKEGLKGNEDRKDNVKQ